MPIRSELHFANRKAKVIILGSGGLSIGQAGEFDYSGTQALKALKEEGFDVLIINPNIATVQTNPGPNTQVYLYPVEPEWVEKVIQEEKPDAIIAGFGGQTALNCLLRLDEMGVLNKYAVLNLGTSVKTLHLTEDRELFARKMIEIGIPTLSSAAVSSLGDALQAADRIGYPVIVRAAYALGGLGSGFANHRDELKSLVEKALSFSTQVLVEKSVKGWKEVEYEVMRDSQGNTITICNMENFDPLGIHTGDSIVVAPSQTLSDDEYQLLRDASLKIVNTLDVVGECNVQFALDPNSLQFYVIEVNARLSRSSALASKASGYPIAYIAAKVALGYELPELKNPVTGITTAFYEPALDYVTVKIPRWDLTKFAGASRKLGSSMKSVGEVMGIGRTFAEALQKSVRMSFERSAGLSRDVTKQFQGPDEIRKELEHPTDQRIFALMEALRRGFSSKEIHRLTAIDYWFLFELEKLIQIEGEIIETFETTATPTPDQWHHWKLHGFGDEQIARLKLQLSVAGKLKDEQIQAESLQLRAFRIQAGITPVVKKIDTTAAEYPSPSNYLYMTYGGQHHDPLLDERHMQSAVVLGGNSYRIGSSVEFDWCAVECAHELSRIGWRSIIINCNPETVSTDYNSSNRLYFDELSLERVLDVLDYEQSHGVVVSMGGQTPNCLALPLARAGTKILGHSAETIDIAEDRSKFSRLLDHTGIKQPRWTMALSMHEVGQFITKVGFPVLVRPSYVLSGSAMNVAYNQASLDLFLQLAEEVSSDYPVVLSEFLEGALEIEVDGVASNGTILISIVSEHIELAGIHSGDATLVTPPQRLAGKMVEKARGAAQSIAKELKLNGPFNIQFLGVSGDVKVIECNARASRSFPFVSKVTRKNLARLATSVLIGKTDKNPAHSLSPVKYIGVKAPMFSFGRISGADPVLGVEMTSTGEVGCIAETQSEAILLSFQATGIHAPKKGVLVSAGPKHDKEKFLSVFAVLYRFGIPVYATQGTAAYLATCGHPVPTLAWPHEGTRDAIRAIREGWVDLVINIPKNLGDEEVHHSQDIRQAAIQYGCSLLTDMEKTVAFINALGEHPAITKTNHLMVLQEFE